MRGIAKRTIYVSTWSTGEPVARKIATPQGLREILEPQYTGMQLREGELYTIPDGRHDLERLFDLYPVNDAQKIKDLCEKNKVPMSMMQAMWRDQRAHTMERRLEILEKHIKDLKKAKTPTPKIKVTPVSKSNKAPVKKPAGGSGGVRNRSGNSK